MGLKTVEKHYVDFAEQIEVIYERELLRVKNSKK